LVLIAVETMLNMGRQFIHAVYSLLTICVPSGRVPFGLCCGLIQSASLLFAQSSLICMLMIAGDRLGAILFPAWLDKAPGFFHFRKTFFYLQKFFIFTKNWNKIFRNKTRFLKPNKHKLQSAIPGIIVGLSANLHILRPFSVLLWPLLAHESSMCSSLFLILQQQICMRILICKL
jgi:hypothetical protein